MELCGRYQALSWRFDVYCSSPVVAAEVRRALVDLHSPGAAAAARYELVSPSAGAAGRLTLHGANVLVSQDEPLLYATLLWHLNRAVVASSADHVLLHAAAAEVDGRAVVLCAPSESGKTTLVAALVAAGWRYLTDEVVAVQPADGWLTPFPKPMSIDDGSWDTLARLRPEIPEAALHLAASQWQVPASSIRAGAVSDGARPAVLVLPQYAAGATTQLTGMSRAEALVELMGQTFEPDRDRPRDLRVLADLVRASACYRLRSGQGVEMVAVLESLVTGVSSEHGDRLGASGQV